MGMVDQSKETLACRRKRPNRKRKRKKEEIGPSLFLTPCSFQLLIETWASSNCIFDAHIYPEALLPFWDLSLSIQLPTLVASLEYLIGLSIKLTTAIMEPIFFPITCSCSCVLFLTSILLVNQAGPHSLPQVPNPSCCQVNLAVILPPELFLILFRCFYSCYHCPFWSLVMSMTVIS